MAGKRNIIWSKKKVGDIYKYKGWKYVRQVLSKPKNCKTYRVIPVKKKPWRKILVCITKKAWPRGGHTKAVALLRSVKTKK